MCCPTAELFGAVESVGEGHQDGRKGRSTQSGENEPIGTAAGDGCPFCRLPALPDEEALEVVDPAPVDAHRN